MSSKIPNIPKKLRNELAHQLNELQTALKSTCHRPECDLTCCPEMCECRSRKLGPIKMLNLSTALVWGLSLHIYEVMVEVDGGWKGWDRMFIERRLMELKNSTNLLHRAAEHHQKDERIRYIFSMVRSNLSTLQKKLDFGSYAYREKEWLNKRNNRIRGLNLRKK
jgi:hypothetical protein